PVDPRNEAEWVATIQRYAVEFKGRVHAVECLNEWDNTGFDPQDAVNCAVWASPILRAAGMKCLLGSVVGQDPVGAIAAANTLLTNTGQKDLIDGVCLHPYARPANGVPPSWAPPEIAYMVNAAYEAAY